MKYTTSDLKQVLGFRDATDDDLHLILENSTPRSLEQAAFFFMQGDPANYLYVLTYGQVKLLQSNPAGQQVNLRTIFPWQMFGALGVVRPAATYPVSAEAMEDSTALAVGSAFLRQMVQSRPHLTFDLMHVMTSYIQEIQTRYRELATERVEQRVAIALLRLASQIGELKENTNSIELSFSRQDLAEMTGTTLFTVSRLLSDWERGGVVHSGRERIRIVAPHELLRISEGLKD